MERLSPERGQRHMRPGCHQWRLLRLRSRARSRANAVTVASHRPFQGAPHDPAAYEHVMHPELLLAAEAILGVGYGRVIVEGAMRLPAQFVVGSALPKVRNVELVRRQGPGLWRTDDAANGEAALNPDRVPIGQGDDVVVVVGLTNDPSADVARFVRSIGLPVAEMLVLNPVGGSGYEVVTGGGNAVAWVVAVRDAVRAFLGEHPGARIHLFMACPGAVAMFLGHRWNRLATTTVYEDFNPAT